MQSITDYLDKWVADIPEQELYTFVDSAQQILESYTYRRLHERSNYLAACLQATGRLHFGSPALLVYPPGLEVIVAFFACLKLGAIPVPIPPPDASGLLGGLEKCAYIAQDTGAVVALTTQSYQQQLQILVERSPEAAQCLKTAPLRDLAWLETDTLQGHLAHFDSRVNPVLFLQYTSGSTQHPRGVMVSHHNVIHNGHATLDHRPIGVSWLPHYHDMGLIGYYLFIMLTGGRVWSFSALNFLKRPLLWLETISRVGATITSAPNFAFEYCLREDKVPTAQLASLDLSSLRCLMNASEPVRSSTYTRFAAKFAACGLAPQAAVVFYGLAENTLSVTGNGRTQVTVNAHLLEQHVLRLESPRSDGYNQRQIVSCGSPLAGVAVQIVDTAAGTAVGEDRLGEIWLAGPSKTAGYWNKPALTQDVFQAVLQDDATGKTYLRTGDIGFLHDGELFVCGRLKDMIIMGGRNYYPTDIEAVVERCSSKIRQGCVAAFAIDGEEGEEIAVLAEVHKANDLPDVEALCHDIRQHCQIDVALFALVPHGTIAKTSSGKIARRLCRQRWQAGAIPTLVCRHQPAGAQDDAVLAHLLRRFSVPGYEDCTLAELGVDSLTLVQLSLYIEGLCKTQGLFTDPASSAQLFDLRVLQTVTVGEIQTLLAVHADQTQALEPHTGAAQAQDMAEIRQAYQERVQAIEQAENQRMRQDAVLPADIAPAGRSVSAGNTVVLTGATGFFGAFLLEALLRLTDYDVVTLVRATDAAHARARTHAALQRTGLWNEALQEAFAGRVVARHGDMAQPQLGLSQAQWDALAHETSAVYHCGAEVDYVQPYAGLHAPNVGGTREILRLAGSGVRKILHFASTTFIFGFCPRHILWESDGNDEMAGLNFGYAQSKWVAEQLVYAAAQRGLPVQVYRPSLITASRQGRYVRRDIMARILAYMIRHGIATDAENQVSLLPVDICAHNMVALSLLNTPLAHTFHLTANAYYSMAEVCALITREFGYTFRYTSLDGFIEHMNAHCTQADPLFPLMAFLNHNVGRLHEMRHKRYDNAHYRLAQTKSSLALPEPPLEDTVRSIVTFLRQENLVPAPPHTLRQTARGRSGKGM